MTDKMTEPVKRERTVADRIMALGAREGATDPVSVVRDVVGVLVTLNRDDEYCWCQTFPCECFDVLVDDLIDCIEVRYPEVKAARIAEQGEADHEVGR